ncbi:MBL fold metallo-hydrolase [Capnocytophaga sp. ARDL2]|uniref:MBL fold metallo-hydrolase n=1 Tax=Capnocytophaga sp. ARDL2 TaxID=3238809 RepID=UPI003555D185
MIIHFLGTGTSQGVPIIGVDDPVCQSDDPRDNRLRTSVWVEWDGVDIVIDCGPDFRYQMLRAKNRNIDAIVFTHEHSDHTAGLDDIRPYCFAEGKIMPFFAQQRVLDSIIKRFDYFFCTVDRYPGAPNVLLNPIEDFQKFDVKGKEIQSFPVTHGKLPILGYKFDNFAYITDSTFLKDEVYELLNGVEVLVINCLRKEPHPSHNHLELALEHIKKIAPKKAYLTHIGFQLGLHEEVQKELPEHVFLAYDGLILEI